LEKEEGKQQLAFFLAICLAGAAACAWVYWPRAAQRATPEQLAQQALSAENPIAQARATTQLGKRGAAPQLREVMAQTSDPEVRATAAQALGDLADFQSVPELLRLCDDASPLVRGRAGAALCSILGADFPFQADLPPDQRARVTDAMRKMYEQMRRSPPPEYRSQTP
jgi:HEAT repeat protein